MRHHRLISLCVAALALAISHAQISPASRQQLETDGHGGKGFTILPLLRDEDPSTVIVLHGLGGTGQEWGYLTLAMSIFSLNYVKFVIPTADTAPVTYLRKELPSWYDIFRLRNNANRISPELNRTQLLASTDRVNNIIQGEIDAGVNASRIFVVGFSQGGGVALTTFLRSRVKLGGCVGVSTWVPLLDDYPRLISNQIRDRDILMVHGTEDDVVPVGFSRATSEDIERHDLSVNFTTIAGGGHVILTERVMNTLEEFITQRAPGRRNFLTSLVNDLTENFDSFTSS